MSQSNLPSVLGRSYAIACSEGLQGSFEFLPASAFRYADGLQMATFCGIVVERTRRDEYLEKSRLGSWTFKTKCFSEVSEIAVPELSLREKIEIDRLLFGMTSNDVRQQLGLSLGATDQATNVLVDNYRAFYRFYPKLARISAV